MAFENFSIRYTKEDKSEFEIKFKVCKMGDFYTAGMSVDINIRVRDTTELKQLTDELGALLYRNYTGIVNVKFGAFKMRMDSSLWKEFSACLSAFAFAKSLRAV